ncbi:MAG: hypothetical protein ABI218_14865 [Caldimonas sp.]
MIHPLLRLAVSQPHLLGDHVEAYASLVGEEVSKFSTSWMMRIGLYMVCLCMVGVGLVLVGVALLICAAIPSSEYPAPWAMFVIPLTPFVIAAGCVIAARLTLVGQPFDQVRKQMHADMAMLREVSTS